MNRLLLYRNFEHEDLVYQMRTLAKKAQIDALTEDDLECYTSKAVSERGTNESQPMDCRKICGTAYLPVYWQMQKMRFLRHVRKRVFRREHYQSLFFQIFHFGKKCLQ